MVRCIVCSMFCILKNIVKNIDVDVFFQKNRQNIASLRKKRDVLHDVLGFRNSIQSYNKNLVTKGKVQNKKIK